MSSDKPRVGFIGLGLMGHGMAKNLVTKGFPLTVRVHRNRKPAEDILAAGAREAKTNAELARASDVVILCVTGSPQIEEIVYGENGILGAAREGLIVVDTSTAEPASTAKIRGDPAYCENVIHVGPPGHGHMLKLVNNFIAMSIATATAEACATCAKSGVSIAKLHEIISAGAVNSGIFQLTAGKMLEGDLTGLRFTLVNAMKDLRYYTHFAESLPTPALIGSAVHQSLVNANLLGFGDKFVASLIEVQEKLAGVKIVPR